VAPATTTAAAAPAAVPLAPATVPTSATAEPAAPAAPREAKAEALPIRTDSSPAPAPLPAPPARIDTAARTFAEAIHRAVTAEVPDAATVTTAAAGTAPMTAPATMRHDAPVDLTRPNWPAKMIERIDMLRDLANANDTSIRLVPDALGTIDVSLRRDGDTVQVHMTAEQPQTQKLLADAAPKLAELAEQRGLKLQQTDTSGGSAAGQQAPHRQQPQQQQPAAPAPAQRRATAESEPADDDTRIA
jgi:Meckel syndrome type 1 protein